ncbi:hypothetical protein EC2726800_1487 [Escherichia coli 2726800]|nr:hypothetical protein EC2726800_1487 [Escherichia coli 2726800]KDW26507.1 hypothetical protein AB86_5143 [Escherichia coli 2-177-06_S3_C1]
MIMTDAVIRRATGIRLPEGKQKATQSGSVIVLMHGGVFSF